MSNDIQSTETELFTELSEQEQEATAGGLTVLVGNYRRFINTSGSNKSNYSNASGDISVNSDSNSQYTSWEESNYMLFDFGNYYSSGMKNRVPPMELIRRIMRSLSS
jgi:hypothetical protein